MTPDTSRIAMLNTLRIGPYDAPSVTNPPVSEWLIAARVGPDRSYLIISDTSISVGKETDTAPPELIEQNSIVAVLAEEDGDDLAFLMMRHLPDDLPIAGRFFPADGVAMVSGSSGAVRLRAFGRHAHSRGSVDGQSVLHDIPHPAPNAEGAINWHFSAEQRLWASTT